jgi:hypothetical protein
LIVDKKRSKNARQLDSSLLVLSMPIKCDVRRFTLLVAIVFATQAALKSLAQSPRSAPSVIQSADSSGGNAIHPAVDQPDVLTPEEWRHVDASVDRALAWLVTQQREDGSFATLDRGQPAVTSLCILAFMAHGNMPGEGGYGKHLERAADYAMRCQKENGLITLVGPAGPRISRSVEHDIGSAAAYNHAISSLTLSEVYGMAVAENDERLQRTIAKSLRATLEMQHWPKDRAVDQGGWRYLNDFNQEDSDLSITGWELKFLRSARNAGFDVPKDSIDEAVAYVNRTFSEEYGAFGYAAGNYDFRSRGMAGAGILALAHAGQHNSARAERTAQWVLEHDFDNYNRIETFTQNYYNDRYHYGLFNCCQGMYQLGGRPWQQFFPRLVRTLLANQQPDGSWPAESHFHDGQFGNAYTTALVVLSLGAPNELLPIYQR